MLQERAERKWAAEERREAAESLVLRLAKLAGSATTSRNNFRVTDSGDGKGMPLRALSACAESSLRLPPSRANLENSKNFDVGGLIPARVIRYRDPNGLAHRNIHLQKVL